MVQRLSRHPKAIAWFIATLFYLDLILVPVTSKAEIVSNRTIGGYPQQSLEDYFKAKYEKGSAHAIKDVATGLPATGQEVQDDHLFTGGPSQPEMAAFTSVNSANMVDLFSGDFSYNIPLMDVGGYPINLAYRGGISMDQEASWVGLGWNINPGTITRNMRGLPDDFNGASDSVKKVMSVRNNKTVGVTGGADIEIAGFPETEQNRVDSNAEYKGIGAGVSIGVFHNSYRGWGLEFGLNASINSGSGSKGPLSGGLGFTNNSQDGLTISPSLSLQLWQHERNDLGTAGSLSIGLPYNSRGGMKGLQVSTGVSQYERDSKNQKLTRGYGESFSSVISFVSPAFTPSISMPYTSRQFSFTGKVGLEKKVYHPSFFLSGYVSTQRIAPKDTLLALPAYGYLHYTQGAQNRAALLDFNREKELPYREKPAVPHIAVPSYTYDAFSITGEGTGGMFRAYRGDIGFIHDHYIRTKDESDRLSVDVGLGDLVHGGVDVNINRAFTQNGPWLASNPLKQIIDFRKDSADFESVYFRNPGEKSINSKAFYNAVGGDDLVTIGLYQEGNSSLIQSTNFLTRYKNKRAVDNLQLTHQNATKSQRDKRAQVISYVTAKEADAGAALTKYIESYTVNQFSPLICGDEDIDGVEGEGIGLPALYYRTRDFKEIPFVRLDPKLDFNLPAFKAPDIPIYPPYDTKFPHNKFSIRWEGRIMAPATGQYVFYLKSDDGVKLWLNDTLLFNEWFDKPMDAVHTDTVNLVQGQLYKIKVDYYENKERAGIKLEWKYPGQAQQVIPHTVLYPPPAKDTFTVGNILVREKRINKFRKDNHISEIDVLNTDGRRYVYGIPVYNLKQKETTFSVREVGGDAPKGLVHYRHDTDNTAKNQNGRNGFYSSEEIPAYAHSFLLTGILSADYSDVTGNGITDDDIGDAVKFNYSKISGVRNPFRWRAPQAADSATYNEGLKSDTTDDKGSYVYGEKELWYLHSIQSKTMIATFVLEGRDDLLAVDERGNKINDGSTRRLKEINLYTKAEFIKKGTQAQSIKTVHFEYGYDLCPGVNGPGTGKLTLKKVWFTYNGNDKGKQNPYEFSYSSKNPEYNIKSYDRWGNYKDPLQNPGSTVGNLITNAEYPYALQDSAQAAQNAGAWMLDSIHLPSGGCLKIKYESDDYAYVQNKRAMQLCKIVGLGASPTSIPVPRLHTKSGIDFQDYLYVFISVPTAVSSAQDAYRKYLADVSKLYFRLHVRMPDDDFGTGSEYVSCYATLSASGGYGIVNSNTIWVKLDGISLKGDKPGTFSPLAKAAIQYLRLNLPSKAYPGSENMGDLDLDVAVKALASLGDNIKNAVRTFDVIARNEGWATVIDPARSFVRLNNPVYKKYGGGYRIKRITVYDNWDKMTGQRAATYGQEYTYTTQQQINGDTVTISSGVASYEPQLGGEENPFRVPIEYVESVSPLGPTTLGYSEEPLGESFYPAAGVGYSCVRTRTIHYQNRKSANGYEETKFYTAYDFPVYTDRTLIDKDTKKRFRPPLTNFLRINARHYLSLSQGFKIELNDMHGKLRSKATYAEMDPKNWVTYSENIYRVENSAPGARRLSNTVLAMHPDGTIDTTALIGKDVELMVDMRQQLSITNGYNVPLNSDMFSVPATPPIFILPTIFNFAQREENIYRSAATVKIIQRYGILDSVIAVDKGSKVSTKDLLYDAETGDVLLTRTQNEFNDYVYNFSYPSHWAYDGMGLAYKNINITLHHIDIRDGRIVNGLDTAESIFFSSGDEILVAGKQKTGDGTGCNEDYSTFPHFNKIWAIDSSVLTGGPKTFYFIDRAGKPYSGYDITLKIIRSGRRNIFGAVGSVTTLESPLRRNAVSGLYELVLDDSTRAIAAGAASFKQFWNTEDIRRTKRSVQCASFAPEECEGDTSCTCKCLRKLFDYLIASKRLFTTPSQNITVDSLVTAANAAGYTLSVEDCHLLDTNANKLFYSITSDSVSHIYKAKIGDCIVTFLSEDTTDVNFYKMESEACDTNEYVTYSYTTDPVAGEQMTKIFPVTVQQVRFMILENTVRKNRVPSIIAYNRQDGAAITYYVPPDAIEVLGEPWGGIRTYLNFDSIDIITPNSEIISANLNLYAYPPGFNSSGPAHAVTDSLRIFVPDFFWDTIPGNYPDPDGITAYFDTIITASTAFQNYSFSASSFVQTWLNSSKKFTGLAFQTASLDTTFFTFASPFYNDSAFRPSLSVTWIPQDSSILKKAKLWVESCNSCTIIIDSTCRSIVVDTTFNPYVVGVLGNWRSDRSFVYYSRRTESDPPTDTTDIRRYGTIDDFAPYWVFEESTLVPDEDTTRWVWNSEMTKVNRKGFEIENRDPLGRYNSVQYGYNLTLPTVVTQNSRSRESAFEGYEDYDFNTEVCDTACSSTRQIDFFAYKARIDTLQRHTGKASLRLEDAAQASLTFNLKTESADSIHPTLDFALLNDTCSPDGKVLESIQTDNRILLPVFSPTPGKKMVLSAWVKEDQDCNCISYTNNQIVVAFPGSDSDDLLFTPTGTIIEGWQRYESVFTIPEDADGITVSLQALTDTVTVYFDDLRIHPFNSNMKSFVFHPVNLRLMAELDENNYATFYEYDDDGTLIRLKKETQRGIKLIRETRSALVKQDHLE